MREKMLGEDRFEKDELCGSTILLMALLLVRQQQQNRHDIDRVREFNESDSKTLKNFNCKSM